MKRLFLLQAVHAHQFQQEKATGYAQLCQKSSTVKELPQTSKLRGQKQTWPQHEKGKSDERSKQRRSETETKGEK